MEKKYELLIAFNKEKKEFRNEKLLMFFILNFTYLDSQYNLENISFMQNYLELSRIIQNYLELSRIMDYVIIYYRNTETQKNLLYKYYK